MSDANPPSLAELRKLGKALEHNKGPGRSFQIFQDLLLALQSEEQANEEMDQQIRMHSQGIFIPFRTRLISTSKVHARKLLSAALYLALATELEKGDRYTDKMSAKRLKSHGEKLVCRLDALIDEFKAFQV